jgi:hypothetical protein
MFVFTCKRDPVGHKPQYRARKDTSSGTHNLRTKAAICDARFLAEREDSLLHTPARDFSPARFRAILGLWCARNHRPFEAAQDELHALMINELRPGTHIPDRTTISRDVRRIYERNADRVCAYFKVKCTVFTACMRN